MRVLLIVLFCLSSYPLAVHAQEDEETEELRGELRNAERQRNRLQARLKVAEERIQILKRTLDLRRQLGSLEEQLEKAEDDDDEPKADRLREEIEQAEFEVELLAGQRETLEQRDELLELAGELREPAQKPLREEAESLLRLLDDRSRLIDQLAKAFREEREEKAEELYETYEENERAFERRREVLGLKVELLWAREEENDEEVRTLLEELKERGVRERDTQTKPVRPQGTLPAPVQLRADEIATAAKLDFEKHIIPRLRSACFECHDGETASGDLNLEAMIAARPLVVNRSHWLNVIQQLKVRSMPPADAKQPTKTDRRTLVAWLSNAIENFDYESVRQPGYEPARRLTHEEYNNTIRDLFGMDLRPADRFPTDLTASSGFENSANSLFIQPITLERYIGAAESVVDAALPEKPTRREQIRAWDRVVDDVRKLQKPDSLSDVLRQFAARGWRRPVGDDEIKRLVRLFRRQREDGATPRGALRDVIQVMLVSPEFLIRSEADQSEPGNAFRISDWELASRLSYFLWASMPDEELFRQAETGRLHEPEVLAAQVQRMLQDPRSKTLGSLFAAQWLGFTELDRVQRDQIDNPWATDSLVEAMKQESAMLFNSLVEHDQPIDRLVDADYSFLNEELARHYRLPGVSGNQMRRVSLKSSPRRGIMGHGSILAITSFPGRTSPVVRGNWILTRLLGTPPPPPPPNVSEFDDRVAENERLSQREKLEQHRSNPNCYACHSQIDPLGFALEEFEWFGRHRPARRGRNVDTTARLPNGTAFRGLQGLSEALVRERIDDLTEQLTRRMLSYSLGRQLEYYDEATVRELVERVQANERRVPALIHAIVQSNTFQMKQVSPARGQD